MSWQHLILPLALSASAHAQLLLTVLKGNGFTGFAEQLLPGDPIFNPGSSLIVYAPSNAALDAGNGTNPITRWATEDDIRQATSAMSAVDSSAPRLPRPPKLPWNNTNTRRDVTSGGSAMVTLLDLPEFVNLGSGRNQVVVEKSTGSDSLPRVFSGLGKSVQVDAAGIPFDNGVIHPIDGALTLLSTVSSTLQALGANRFHDLAKQSGLLDELDTKPGITVLAPNDDALANIVNWSDSELLELLKQHVLVDYPAYTPIFEGGDKYPTLAGTNVTISVRDGVVQLNGARILAGDAIAKNGLVHVINQVLGGSSTPPPGTGGATTTIESLSWKALACSFVGVLVATRNFNLA